MNQIHLLLLLGIVLASNSCTPGQEDHSSKADKLPNIILLIGDDQGYPYFGFMGADYVHTPNMDQLAADGIVFTDGYVPDNHCRPSLQTLLTGTLPIDFQKSSAHHFQQVAEKAQYPADSLAHFRREFDIKAKTMAQINTLPKLLATKGYASFQGGKWWEFSYQNGGFSHGMTKGWKEGEEVGNWFLQHMGGEGMELARITNQPVYDFLEETKGDPFFIWYAPSLPHYPFDAPARYYDLYKDQHMTESAKQYYANCTWFDDAWGEMVSHLKEKGLYDNTLIVYVNDNGWEQDPDQEYWEDPMRSHNGGDKGKGSIYDMSFRSPIIFAWANEIEAGMRTDALIHSADIPATILDYAGISVPAHYFGTTYRSLIAGQEDEIRDHILGNVITTRSKDPNNVMGDHVEGFWIREGNWFLRWHATHDELELFDVEKDPRNNQDLADQYPEVVTQLQAKLEAYRAEKGRDKRLEMYELYQEQGI